MAKPKLFIGSSTAAVDAGIVRAFADSLSNAAACVPWNDAPEFSDLGSKSTLDALRVAINEYDYAVFIFSADDTLFRNHDKKQKFATPRDNVVFELGLFIGVLGPDRVVSYLHSSGDKVWVLSDMNGISMPRFEFPDDRHEQISCVNKATGGLIQSIGENGFRPLFLNIVYSWGFSSGDQAFRVRLNAVKVNEANISKFRICLAARIHDEEDEKKDEAVVFSEPRDIPKRVTENIPLSVSGFPRHIPTDETNIRIQGYILLIPTGVDITKLETLGSAEEEGCRIVQTPFVER